ncbi:GTPase [Planctomicrobium sp. SH668]|uniref:GTPase n=1 Tax=Planctomicrobium sp. SH668 TaxID=3448126 RepID=UPI003F5C59E2
MSFSEAKWPSLISELTEQLVRLNEVAAPLKLTPLNGEPWFQLLQRKLQPQLGKHSFLILAVVGGTNIGKSSIFNHLAGGKISATSPLASGTKHPSATLSPELAAHVELTEVFPEFNIIPWRNANFALQTDGKHLLYYHLSELTPPNLIILDTPDIDSVEQVNWERADAIRQSADVLIAVLTQQKYNDASVKEFFRQAAHEGKLVIVIFNQCLIPDDLEYVPLWLKTFCEETGIRPELVYLSPYDRRAAEENRLPFFELPLSGDANSAQITANPKNLLNDLSRLKFEAIRTQALSGAINHLISQHDGIPAWLNSISIRSREFTDALNLLTGNKLLEIEQWPNLPNKILIEQIRLWWKSQREGWTANVHGFYQRLGEIISMPIQAVLSRSRSTPDASPLDRYREEEWTAILSVLERCFQRMEWAKELGNPLLTPRLTTLLSGDARAKVIQKVRDLHEQLDFEAEVRTLVETQLRNFKTERPDFYRIIRNVDSLAAATRPVLTIALFMTGAGPVGHAITPIITDSAMQGALHLAGDAIGGTVATAVGDKVITETASGSAGYLEAKFRQLHTAFAQHRVQWVMQQLEACLIGDFVADLKGASQIDRSPEFQSISRLVGELQNQMHSASSVKTGPLPEQNV